jgi:hypothetical protein
MEIAPEVEPASGEVEIYARGPVCFSYRIRCPIGGWQVVGVHSDGSLIMLLHLDTTVVL